MAKLVDGVVTEKYLWQDLTTLLAVYDANGNVKQRFEYGLSHTPVSFTQSGQRYYIQTDHLGSPRVISSATGTVIKTLSYDSYGNVIEDSNPSFSIPFGFAGGLQDSDTGLIRFGYRDYDPETGRWTARDPIGFAGGDTNLYGYVLGDPVNFYDPDGLFALPVIPQGVVDAVAGFGDAISFGLTDKIRDAMGTNSGVDKCSSIYAGGAFVANFVDLRRGAVSGLRTVAKKVHGNSKSSTKEQHLYMILDVDGNIKKVGVSGQKLNKNGTSPRANSQLNDGDTATVLESGILGRTNVLQKEGQLVEGLRRAGHELPDQKRPKI